MAKTTLTSTHNFVLTADKSKVYDLYYGGFGLAETYLNETNSDTINVNLSIPAKYKKRFGKVSCPKCKKADQTIPIFYGLKTIVIYNKDQPPYITYEGFNKKEIYDGGCVTSGINPKWFCKRNKIKF